MSDRTRQHGFTLVELLVAMAIFITIMGGITVLFTGAIRTVRQGNQQMDLFSIGRGMMTVMERDMSAAFTARELGEYFQFYGRAEGFMFVGKLDNGQLGRVTYVINPNVDTRQFETNISEPWINVWERVVTFAAERARANGITNDAAVIAAQQDASNYFQSFYPAPSGIFLNVGDLDNDLNRTAVDFNVRTRTYALLRYQENVADLDNFKPLHGANDSILYQWPYIDPSRPSEDRVDSDPDGIEEALYTEILGGIGGTGNDIRNALLFTNAQLHAINAKTVGALIAAKKREVWIRLLAGDASLGVPAFWGDPSDPDDDRPLAKDYVIAERILVEAVLLSPDSTVTLTLPSEPASALDALLVPGIFNYGAIDNGGNEVFRRTFNALENLNADGYENLRQQAITYSEFLADPGARAKDYDEALVRALGERRDTALLAGSPLAPRLPALISPGLWFMDASPAPGAADFRRWFTQTIEVPSATGRDVSPRVTARAQQG